MRRISLSTVATGWKQVVAVASVRGECQARVDTWSFGRVSAQADGGLSAGFSKSSQLGFQDGGFPSPSSFAIWQIAERPHLSPFGLIHQKATDC